MSTQSTHHIHVLIGLCLTVEGDLTDESADAFTAWLTDHLPLGEQPEGFTLNTAAVVEAQEMPSEEEMASLLALMAQMGEDPGYEDLGDDEPFEDEARFIEA